jgi:hypothetical protein
MQTHSEQTSLPAVRTSLSPEVVRDLLGTAARKGKMPGLMNASVPGAVFGISDFGHPFESVLQGHLSEGRISFTIRLKPLMPLVTLAILIATVWPGVWFTDSMLRTYFSGYQYQTWMWYLPLTIPTVPWVMWSTIKKSRVSARADAPELIEKVAIAIGGTVDPPAPVPPTAASAAHTN